MYSVLFKKSMLEEKGKITVNKQFVKKMAISMREENCFPNKPCQVVLYQSSFILSGRLCERQSVHLTSKKDNQPTSFPPLLELVNNSNFCVQHQ